MTVLLLAGTGEARVIAAGLAARGIDTVASLAGAVRRPEVLPVETRIGGFGGLEGFEAFLDARAIRAVVDATHPFAARITARTVAVCAARGLPCLQVRRAEWRAGPGDNWREIAREEEAAEVVPEGARVFLGTGRQGVERFAGLAPRRVWCRRIDPTEEPFPFPGGDWLIGRPPFPVAQEMALFARLSLGWLVVKNSGGMASATKLEAARRLSLPVLMLRRPPPPEGARVETAEAALDWVARL